MENLRKELWMPGEDSSCANDTKCLSDKIFIYNLVYNLENIFIEKI